MPEQQVFAPGANILARDEAWRVQQVSRTSSGGLALKVVGISELVQDKESIFLTDLEPKGSIQVLDPKTTELVSDDSSNYQASLLYMESILRRIPPTDNDLHIGHRAAMDVLEYQLEPAAQALEQPRQRILIADAVGLGKTLEAGILMSELIRRGRGKRILVVAIKSMLTQFQKELWSRFTIPLVRLDSIGLQRIRQNIPTNHNPFYHYDRSIISIDTLKQNNEFRVHLEQAYWDIIVIDEAHNVAVRGTQRSQRAELAELLAHRSDTLIMLSATPHDGKARSFASLMNMLDPTAIADPDNYTPDEIDGLYIRRFKKDIADQVQENFPDRKIVRAKAQASEKEEEAFDALVELRFAEIDRRASAGHLFKTTLEKALLSSPAACIETIDNRLKKIDRTIDPDRYLGDAAILKDLRHELEEVGSESFAKYQKLLELLRDDDEFSWSGHFRDDRMVIFTERIETMNWLARHIVEDLEVDPSKVETLHGGMSDIDQQRVVEEFGQEKAKIRLLIASDVASEGINLHYMCHRMIHFDIPWSLMVFQQRNGRIDRYGQKKQPLILYLYTDSQNEKLRGDTRILELLIEKDEQATKNIGDPGALMGVYDVEEEERITAEAIESGADERNFEEKLKESSFNPLDLMLQETSRDTERTVQRHAPLSLFRSDYAYTKSALEHLSIDETLDCSFDDSEKRIGVLMPDDLEERFEMLPDEIAPDDRRIILSADTDRIQDAIAEARTEESAWPVVQYLWPLNPVTEWLNDRMAGNFGRHTAPVLSLDEALEPGEVVFVVSGLIPNKKSHPLIHRWFGVVFRDGDFERVETYEETVKRIGLGEKRYANRGDEFNEEALGEMLRDAVETVRLRMSDARDEFRAEMEPKLDHEMEKLDELQSRQLAYLDEVYAGKTGPRAQHEKRAAERQVKNVFDEYLDWVEETMTTEDAPFIQVIAVLVGS